MNKKQAQEYVAAEATKYFKETGNKPISIRDLTETLQNRGVLIPGKQPGSTLGAILFWRKTEFQRDNKGGWYRISGK